jgi:hypothetical protein
MARVLDLAALEFGVMHPDGQVDSTAGYGIIITEAAVRELNDYGCQCGQAARPRDCIPRDPAMVARQNTRLTMPTQRD